MYVRIYAVFKNFYNSYDACCKISLKVLLTVISQRQRPLAEADVRRRCYATMYAMWW